MPRLTGQASCAPPLNFLGWLPAIFSILATFGLALAIRLLEWPCWQNPEYRLGNELLLATHDAYHWLAGAVGFGRAVDHPMAQLLRLTSDALGCAPAAAAFWLPAVFAGFVAVAVNIWCCLLGNWRAGMAAGLIASIAPGFLGRTLLGYYDTDMVTLLFPLVCAIVPAAWSCAVITAPPRECEKPDASARPRFRASGMFWPVLLGCWGLFSFYVLEWHSVFAYIVRFNVALLGCVTFLALKRGAKGLAASWGLCYALPALEGNAGLVIAASLVAAGLAGQRIFRSRPVQAKTVRLIAWICLLTLWGCVCWLAVRGDILETVLQHAGAYIKQGGDTHLAGGVELVFPSVAQSIIEVQDLPLAALLPYFHPWSEAGLAGYLGFLFVLVKRPAALYLAPLAALGLLASRLGGRMVMFGAPIVAIGLALPVMWLAVAVGRRYCRRSIPEWSACALLCAGLVLPFLDMVPSLSQGPSINRRQAAALAQAGLITPPDAMLWLWWDWGYAAHYFSRRNTVADGAQHGGPSLYLPAAVFATDRPRFARQIIRRLSSLDNQAGRFFEGMDASRAQELVNTLRSQATPLVEGRGRQFIITSFEMLRLGFWISNFGHWNFVTGKGEGGALSIIPQAVAYRLNAGEVRLGDSPTVIYPASISVFEETGLAARNYVAQWFQAHPNASRAEQQAWLNTRRNINFLFNRVTDEKLAVDQGIYNSLMVQLLVCDPQDPRITPYFRLVYDNVFARIYEVLPVASAEAVQPE